MPFFKLISKCSFRRSTCGDQTCAIYWEEEVQQQALNRSRPGFKGLLESPFDVIECRQGMRRIMKFIFQI